MVWCCSNRASLATVLSTNTWRHNGCDGVSNHQPRHCLLNRLFRRRSKKTSKLCVTGLCAGNSPLTGEFPAQMASNAENVSIWWRHHCFLLFTGCLLQFVATGTCRSSCKIVIPEHILWYNLCAFVVKLVSGLMPQNAFDDKSTMVQVKA